MLVFLDQVGKSTFLLLCWCFTFGGEQGVRLGSFIPQPAEYGAEEFCSRRCPDAGVGQGLGLGIIGCSGGIRVLAEQSFREPSKDPDGVYSK